MDATLNPMTVIPVSSPVSLPLTDLTRYQSWGYVAVRGRFSRGEVTAWEEECDRLFRAAASAEARIQYRQHEDGGRIADRIDPLLDISPVFDRLARDPRVTGAVESALAGPSVVMKAKLITKRPGTHGYGLHQDYPYWAWTGIPADQLLSVLVAVDPASTVNGGLEVWAGLHRTRLPGAANDPMDVDEAAIDLSQGETVPLDAGDLLIFHSQVPHRSAPNRSLISRRAVFLTYTRAEYAEAARGYREKQLAGK